MRTARLSVTIGCLALLVACGKLPDDLRLMTSVTLINGSVVEDLTELLINERPSANDSIRIFVTLSYDELRELEGDNRAPRQSAS